MILNFQKRLKVRMTKKINPRRIPKKKKKKMIMMKKKKKVKNNLVQTFILATNKLLLYFMIFLIALQNIERSWKI